MTHEHPVLHVLMQETCLQVYLDNTTPNLWDNGYYKNLLDYNGILLSDEALYADS